MNIPVYRARVLGLDNNYIIGFYQQYIEGFEDNVYHEINNTLIDPTTLAIHFEDMLDSQGNKIFASLSENGKGGDIVISKSYPFYGDAPEITDSSGKCEELNYKGLLLFTSTGCCMDYIKVSDRVRGYAIGCAIEDFNEFESIGIQE